MFQQLPKNEMEMLIFLTFYNSNPSVGFGYIHKWYKQSKQWDLSSTEYRMFQRILYAINNM